MIKRRNLIAVLSAALIAAPAIFGSVPAAAAEVSPMMESLISDFSLASLRLNAMDMEGDPDAYSAVSKDRSAYLIALTFSQPANLTELSAKLAALVEFTEDTERFTLRVVVEDAIRLEGGK